MIVNDKTPSPFSKPAVHKAILGTQSLEIWLGVYSFPCAGGSPFSAAYAADKLKDVGTRIRSHLGRPNSEADSDSSHPDPHLSSSDFSPKASPCRSHAAYSQRMTRTSCEYI